MGNLNFNILDAFASKCKILEGYGYTFPEQIGSSYNDIDYDENGNLYTNVKIYKLILILDSNENTHIQLAKYYKATDANNAKSNLSEELIYDNSQLEIQESTEKIYSAIIDSLITLEEETEEDNSTDFDIEYSNVGNVYEFKVTSSALSSDSSLNGTTFRTTLDKMSVILEAEDSSVNKIIVHRLLPDNSSKIEYSTIIYNM
jgi:hypothetical protein